MLTFILSQEYRAMITYEVVNLVFDNMASPTCFHVVKQSLLTVLLLFYSIHIFNCKRHTRQGLSEYRQITET